MVSNSLWPHTTLPCPSPPSRICSNSHPLSQWCHPTTSPSVTSFSCPQFFPASVSFLMSQLFTAGGLSLGASASVNSPSDEYSGLISFRLTGFDLLAVQRTLKSLLQYHSLKASILWCSTFFTVQLAHLYTTTGKFVSLTRQTFVSKSDVSAFQYSF